MKAIHEVLQDDYVVWGLGQAGQEFPLGVALPSIKGISCHS